MGVMLQQLGSYTDVGKSWARIKRGVHTLSDGSLVAIVLDTNRSIAARAGGGDSSNLAKFYVYTSPDGSAWTLKSTVVTALDTSTDKVISFSSAVDVANNIHIVYCQFDSNVMYRQLTYNAGNYTQGTIRTVWTNTGTGVGAVDIDSLDDTAGDAVIAIMNNAATGGAFIRWVVCLNGGATQYTDTTAQKFTNGAYFANLDVTVSSYHTGISGNVTRGFAIAFSLISNDNRDLGDCVECFRVNTSNAASANNTFNITAARGLGGKYRRVMLFNCEDDPGKLCLVGAGPSDSWYTRKINVTGTVDTWSLLGNALSIDNTDHPTAATTSVSNQAINRATFAYRYGRAAIFTMSTADAYLTEMAKYSGDIPTWVISTQVYQWDKHPTGSIAPISCVVGGANRNLNLTTGASQGPPTLVYYLASTSATMQKRVEFRGYALPLAPINTRPNVVESTSYPTLEAKYQLPYDLPQSPVKVQWQVSADTNFTTLVTNYTQPDTLFTRAVNTTQSTTDARTLYIPNTPISSGTRYVRSRQIDIFGNLGPWSPLTTFTIAHPPGAVRVSPSSDVVLPYSASGVTVTWEFTDPNPQDYQTAYEILITNVVDGSVVIDTGHVASNYYPGQTSGKPSALVTISSVYKDLQLAIQVKLADGDGTWGDYSDAQTFYISDPPAPTITNPASGAVISAGQPTISWSPGLSASKIQVYYRVQITQGNNVIWSAADYTADTSVIVPPGFIHNNQQYTVSLYIVDSTNLKSTLQQPFSTSFTPPAGVTDIRTYLYEYDRKGFVYVGWTGASADANFYSWTLYRQAVTDPAPTILKQAYQLNDVYGYRDHGAASGIIYLYWVSQTISINGDLVESVNNTVLQIEPQGTQYWITDPLDEFTAMPLFNVTNDAFTDEYEEATVTVWGRGRHVDRGEALGYTGSLSVQVRDKDMGYQKGYNWFSNSSLLPDSTGFAPDKWNLSSAGAVTSLAMDYQAFIEPNPTGKLYVLELNSAASGITTSDYIELLSPGVQLVKTDLLSTSKISAYIWVAVSPLTPANFTVKGVAEFRQTDDTTVYQSTTYTATLMDTYEPAGSLDTNVGAWKKYAITADVPVGIPTSYWLHVRFRLFNSSAAIIPNWYVAGVGLNSGTVALNYFDATMRGVDWVAGQVNGPSVSYGAYAAREQRLSVREIIKLNRPVYLRTPFGDVLYVHLGGQDATRKPGTGADSDLTDVNIPYSEVAY